MYANVNGCRLFRDVEEIDVYLRRVIDFVTALQPGAAVTTHPQRPD